MEVDIVKIGNSKGIRLPASVLKQCGIDKKVTIKINGNTISITPSVTPRKGWAEAFAKASTRIHEDDSAIYEDSLDLDKLEV